MIPANRGQLDLPDMCFDPISLAHDQVERVRIMHDIIQCSHFTRFKRTTKLFCDNFCNTQHNKITKLSFTTDTVNADNVTIWDSAEFEYLFVPKYTQVPHQDESSI